MAEINEVKEPTAETPTKEELIKRYAEVQKITVEEASEQIDAETVEEMLKKIENKTLEKIRASQPPMNRAQRRALKKKIGAKKYAEMMVDSDDAVGAITETAKKLNYIDLIQKLRKLNEEKQNDETIIEDD